MLNIKNLLTDNTNVIRIYFINKTDNHHKIDLSISIKNIDSIKKIYKNWKIIEYSTYQYNNLSYEYDLTDDSQIVYSNTMEKYELNDNLLYMSYNYSKHPTHLFPCINTIDNIRKYSIQEYKISNRISLLIETDIFGNYLYLEYKHSVNVDTEKIESMLKSTIENIKKMILT